MVHDNIVSGKGTRKSTPWTLESDLNMGGDKYLASLGLAFFGKITMRPDHGEIMKWLQLILISLTHLGSTGYVLGAKYKISVQ